VSRSESSGFIDKLRVLIFGDVLSGEACDDFS